MSTLRVRTGPYHHGNLKAELLAAGLATVRAGGMDALAARELAREVGVTPAAVYRHFADIEHLRAAVSQAAREQLAMALHVAQDGLPRRRDPARAADERLRAIGAAYVHFAVDEPGLFDAAFAACGVLPEQPDDPSAMGVLVAALDGLVDVGLLDPARREEAPLIAWTSVHGLASIMAHQGGQLGIDLDVAIGQVVEGVHRALGIGPPPRA